MKFFVLLRAGNCKIKRMLHEKVTFHRRKDTGNLSQKKQTRADAYFIVEISKKF